jgi:hypothetical protein
MLEKLGSIDFGKWALDTSSGFIVATAVMFIIDSLVPGHMTENIFTDISAGKIVVFGLAALVVSSALGLMMDSIFHTAGRGYIRKFWMPLRWEYEFRELSLKDVGLTLRDFDWIYANTKDRLSAEVEKDYLRFTEVAGSAAYTMLLLFGPASFMFLRMEYHQDYWLAMGVAIFVAIGGLILLFTNAESLYKYEKVKTSVVIDDIRKMNTNFNVNKTKEKCGEAGFSLNRISLRLFYLTWIIVLSGLLLLGSHFVVNAKISEEDEMANYILISKIESSTDVNKAVPTIDMVVYKDAGTPQDLAAGKVVAVNTANLSTKLIKSIELKKDIEGGNLVNQLIDIEKPPWKLTVSFINTANLTDGDYIYINAYLSFVDGSGNKIEADKITLGDWLFPVIVTDDSGSDYLLAQIHVSIKEKPESDGDDK